MRLVRTFLLSTLAAALLALSVAACCGVPLIGKCNSQREGIIVVKWQAHPECNGNRVVQLNMAILTDSASFFSAPRKSLTKLESDTLFRRRLGIVDSRQIVVDPGSQGSFEWSMRFRAQDSTLPQVMFLAVVANFAGVPGTVADRVAVRLTRTSKVREIMVYVNKNAVETAN